MKQYIGIDGGGTKTKFTMCREDGKILGSFVTSTSHYLQCGLDGMMEVITSGLSSLDPDRSSDTAGIFMGCAGFGDVKSDEPLIRDAALSAVEEVYGKGKVTFSIGNDCENALAGALGGADGINIIAGTGSMGCGKNGGSDVLRCGGWHHAIGSDEGSGYWIGWRMIKEFQRQSDGRDEKTPLYGALKERLGIRSDDEIISLVVEEWDMDRTKIASLAPLCGELGAKGDPFAKEIFSDAVKELFDIASTLYRRLGFEGRIKVSGTGGIFNMKEFVTNPFAEILDKNNMQYEDPLYEPDIGAVILAMKKDGKIPPDRFIMK